MRSHIGKVQHGLPILTCGAQIVKFVAQITDVAPESQSQMTKWYRCHRPSTSEKDRTFLLPNLRTHNELLKPPNPPVCGAAIWLANAEEVAAAGWLLWVPNRELNPPHAALPLVPPGSRTQRDFQSAARRVHRQYINLRGDVQVENFFGRGCVCNTDNRASRGHTVTDTGAKQYISAADNKPPCLAL